MPFDGVPRREERGARRRAQRLPEGVGSAVDPPAVATTTLNSTDPLNSFWMGGFEGADHVNGRGIALDMCGSTGHAERIEADHALAAAMGLRTVRESIGWRLAEPSPGSFDVERTLRIARSAHAHGLQVVWTFMHYGTPADVSLLDDEIVGRFVRFAVAIAEVVGPWSAQPPVYNLINEIGFLAWAACATNMVSPYRGEDDTSPEHRGHVGYGIKRRLVQATIEAMQRIRRSDPRARFLHIEPVIHVTAPRGRPELEPLAATLSGYQWQVWDMLCGRLSPELGGTPEMLDLLGVNHYHDSQWEAETGARLHWSQRHPQRRPLSLLLQDVWQRYGRPLLLSETSHVGEGRATWLHEVAAEVERARLAGVPLQGICLYPLIDRPSWDDASHWHHSGLWDVARPGPDGASPLPVDPGTRVLALDYARALQRWQQRLPSPSEPQGHAVHCLIVFSHLRWGFVYQRPQHLMSRLGQHYRVLFVEEPVFDQGPAWLDRMPQGPGLEVLVPHTPIDAAGFHDDQLATLQGLIGDYLAAESIDDYLVWLYTPMALPMLAPLTPRAVIFDCMDELSAFDHAPRQLRQREAALLKTADLVLTGGPALYEAKRSQHPNVHCMPSSVDAAHFSPQGLDATTELSREADALQARIPGPRLGFFGVIDERFDVALLETLALAHPEWQLVMAGPVVKIDPARLPRHPNIHWLGMQSYQRLPYLLAGWDLCLMPFALNESTRFISPTKTLEYMAGEKPIVSTPVRDVVGLYGHAVRIAEAGPDFVRACEEALAETDAERAQRKRQMLETVQRSSWDRVAEDVHRLIEAAVEARVGGAHVAAGEVDAVDAVVIVPVSGQAFVPPPAERVAAG